jgi:hypothetical protein
MSTDTASRPAPFDGEFTWGDVRNIHYIGEYAIVEYDARRASNAPEDEWAPHICFHPYIWMQPRSAWHDMARSFLTLDSALIASVIYRREWFETGDVNVAANSRLHGYIMRLVPLAEEEPALPQRKTKFHRPDPRFRNA